MPQRKILKDYMTWDSRSTSGEYPSTYHVCPECGALCDRRDTDQHITFHVALEAIGIPIKAR
jgi:hypothetical protein